MTTQHPITPPTELVQQWRSKWMASNCDRDSYQNIATQAARWGADQELEACCEWLTNEGLDCFPMQGMRKARRPKPPSLKELAQRILVENGTTLDGRMELDPDDIAIIRRALEQLDD